MQGGQRSKVRRFLELIFKFLTCKKRGFRLILNSLKRMENKILRQREIVRANNEEKRQERSTRNEAIRVKYGGLFKSVFLKGDILISWLFLC